jgi:hypothetical protein
MGILPKWYGDFTTFILLVGLIIVLPIVLIFGPKSNSELNVNKMYYCYLNGCDGVTQIYGLKYSEKLEEYLGFFKNYEGCIAFELPEGKPGLIRNHMYKLKIDSMYYVKSIINDSTIAKIKVKNFDMDSASLSADYFYLWVPLYTLKASPPQLFGVFRRRDFKQRMKPQLAQVYDL